MAQSGTGKKCCPFSSCVGINRTIGLACVAKHDWVTIRRHHDAHTASVRAGQTWEIIGFTLRVRTFFAC